MNYAARYYSLWQLGRDAFMEAVAPGALVRDTRVPLSPPPPAELAIGSSENVRRNLGITPSSTEELPFEVYPLVKRTDGGIVDVIVVGRTEASDLVIPDRSISRSQAFFRRRDGVWTVCDAHSRNGTFVENVRLVPHEERELGSATTIRFGRVDAVLYTADELFDVLGSSEL